MMRFNAFLLSSFAIAFLASACDSKDSPKPATTDAANQAEDNAQSQVQRKLPAPPGEPGPVLIRMTNSFPTQIFAVAATENHVAFAMQSDVRDVSLCTETELPVCFHGSVLISQRRNPNQPKLVKLYESDTQSGSRMDDAAAAGNKFVIAISEGRYVGDTPVSKLVIVDENAVKEREIILSAPDIQISHISLNPLEDGRVLVCKSFEPIQGNPGLICEKLDPSTGKLTPVATIQTKNPIRSFEIALSEERILAAWIESGIAQTAFLNAPDEKLELGVATALKPHLAAGLNNFAIVWQSDDAQTHVDKLPIDKSIKSIERQTMTLNGLDYRSINGLAAVSEGYLFAFRHQNTQQMALISTDFKSWNLLSNSNNWRMISDYAVIDIQEAHTGKIVWQTAESIVGLQ